MKKILAVLLVLFTLAGCSNSAPAENGKETVAETKVESETEEKGTIVVGASIVPHAEILEQTRSILADEGYELKIVEFADYVQPNLALDTGDLDANYFQHEPYLISFNEEHNLDLVSVGKIHYEPFGIYQGQKSSLDEVEKGDKISVPNDPTNEARALGLLEAEGVITIKEGAGLNATKLDIVDNPHEIEIVELEAAQLAKSIDDVAFSVINGNYALQDGLTADQVIAFESKDSVGAETFANVVAVKAGNENNPKIIALMEALQSEKIKTFIQDTYEGAVEPSF